MKSFVNSAVLLGLLPLAAARAMGGTPKYPHDANATANCNWWFDYTGSPEIACKDVPTKTFCSLADFLRWNPVLGTDCTNFEKLHSYCVDGPPPGGISSSSSSSTTTTSSSTTSKASLPPTTTTSQTTSTTKVDNGISTPSPTQPGMVDNCNKFYYVQHGDTCESIARDNGLTPQQFADWNKDVGGVDCYGLWADVYACVNIIGRTPTTAKPHNAIPTPSPLQAKIIDNCGTFYYVRSGQSCDDVAAANGITSKDLVAWNRAIGSGCSGLYGDSYACVRPVGDYYFANTTLADWNTVDGNASIQNQAMFLEPANDSGKAYVDAEYHDFMLDATVSLSQATGSAGIVIRGSNFNKGTNAYSGYYVGIEGRDGGRIVLGAADNNWREITSKSVEIKQGVAYRLIVEASGDNIIVSLGTRPNVVINVRDGTWRSGSVGVRTSQTSAAFSNIRVRPMYFDPFDVNLAGWTIADGGFDARSSFVNAPKTDSGKATLNTIFGDMTLEADMFVIGDEGNAGLMFAAKDLGQGADSFRGYYVGLTTSSVILGRDDYGWTPIKSVNADIANSQWHHIRIVFTSGVIVVYVDDMVNSKIVAVDRTFTSGKVGMRLYKNGALYDNFKITQGTWL